LTSRLADEVTGFAEVAFHVQRLDVKSASSRLREKVDLESRYLCVQLNNCDAYFGSHVWKMSVGSHAYRLHDNEEMRWSTVQSNKIEGTDLVGGEERPLIEEGWKVETLGRQELAW
jgi:hypothetical protein